MGHSVREGPRTEPAQSAKTQPARQKNDPHRHKLNDIKQFAHAIGHYSAPLSLPATGGAINDCVHLFRLDLTAELIVQEQHGSRRKL